MADLGGEFRASDYLNSSDPYTSFRDAMAEYSLFPGEVVVTSGFERFSTGTNGTTKKKNGYYSFQVVGDLGFGCFGDWARDIHVPWSSVSEQTMTVSQRLQYQEIIETTSRIREEEKKEKYAAARIKAAQDLSAGVPVISHKYLTSKRVKSQPDFVVNSKKEILIPVINIDGDVISYQRIAEDGEKRFLYGGQIKGGMYCIAGTKSGVLCVCEGVATGLSINEATGYSVICAFNAGNLKEVALNVSKNSGTSKIVICADNDTKTEGNPGVTKGKEAAQSINAMCVYPVFDAGKEGTDFNDLAATSGIEEVAVQINSVVRGGPVAINKSNVLNLSECFDVEPPKRQWLINGLIPAGKVGAIVGAGGTGKSNFTLLLARIMASGWELSGLKAGGQRKVLIVNVEDDELDIKRRLYAQKHIYAMKEGEMYFLNSNLMIYPGVGIVKPFMKGDGGSNPVLTEWAEWLDRSIGNTKPDCVVLDTRSRLYGLDENNNDHAAQWIGMLEGLVAKYGCTFLIIHHVGKAAIGSHDQGSARGASAFVDNCRFVISLAGMDEATSKKYGLKGKEGKYFSMTASKANYAESFLPVWFEKMDEGVPVSVDLGEKRDNRIITILLQIIGEIDGDFSKRDLARGDDFAGAREKIKDHIGLTSREISEWVDRLLDEGKLITKEVQFDTGRPKKCLGVA